MLRGNTISIKLCGKWALLIKKTTLYAERNEEERAEFLKEIAEIPPENIAYVDESGFDPGMCRKFARALRGKKARGNVKGKREKRINVIAALILGKICAFFPSSENTDTDLFKAWVKLMLIPSLKSGMIVIMDNAKFHKSKEIRELIEDAGCRLIYLPPYSPDFNKIEQRWAVIKTEVKKIKDSLPDFGTAVRTAVQKYA